MQDLIQPEEARQRIFADCREIESVRLPLADCAGAILREAILADRDLPPFDRSMMDGYAIRAAEISAERQFHVTLQAPAGKPQATLSDEKGAAAEIMTGAVVPRGADTVLPYEATDSTESGFRIRNGETARMGDFIHRRGSDHPKGTRLAGAGRRMNCHLTAVAATCGYSHLEVSRIPKITILGTGDEVVPVEAVPEPHQIRSSNGVAIQAALHHAGLPGADSLHARDSAEASLSAIREALQTSDFLITTGGISMGKHDYIPKALEHTGMQCRFHGVRQKPGKPFAFFSGGGRSIFALPGNPLSTLSCLHHYVIPAIRHAMGETGGSEAPIVSLAADTRVRGDLTVFLPVRLEAQNRARACPPSNSGDLVSVLASDGYLVLAPGADTREGSQHSFQPWY